MSVTERAQRGLEPYAGEDPDGLLAGLTAGFMAPLEICDVASDADSHIAFGTVLDPDAADARLLPWLAQFSGDRFLPGDGEAAQREKLTSPSNFFRGTTEAIRAEIRPVLTGNQSVIVLDFVGGNQFAVSIITRTSETPAAAAVIAAGNRQVAPWLLVTYVVSDDPIIDEGGAARTIDAIGSAGTTIDGITLADWT